MTTLNERNETTKKIIHIMVTSLCARNCPHCCNKQYSLDDVPYVTEEELEEADTICITGGEPFLFTDPCQIAEFYKSRYKNIKTVYVYSNAIELGMYLRKHDLHHVDGITLSLKGLKDKVVFENEIVSNTSILKLKSNILYEFNDFKPENRGNFKEMTREWQVTFAPATNSIFRKA